MIHQEDENPTFEDRSPVFSSWNSWYILVIIINILIVGLVSFLFSLI